MIADAVHKLLVAGVLVAKFDSVVPLMLMMFAVAVATLVCGLWARSARS